MISLKDIEVRFGSFQALQEVNIDIGEGEFFTFLGPSGCGKTTTLRTLGGFIKPSRGRVFIQDTDVTELPVEQRNIGMVFQSYALFPTMDVYENIAFGLKVKKLPQKEIREKVYTIAHKVDIDEEQLDKKVSELSGGQQQRVAIARALITQPSIICLDEPLSNLDAKLRVQLRNELKDLQQQFGITTVYVTHDQEEALILSDRIAVFNKGRIEQIGKPQEIYNRSATEFVCNFIGDINLLDTNILQAMHTKDIAGIQRDKRSYLRLECVHIAEGGQPSDGAALKGVIKRMEYCGLYTKYHLDVAGSPIKCIEKGDGHGRFVTGQTVQLHIDPAHIMQY
ncbi:MAG: ABC transporter ATP-binding protein [Anaerocolumna sp.]